MKDDTISRAAALTALNGCTEIYINNLPPTIYKEDAIKAVKAQPSATDTNVATTQPKYDEWCTDCREYDHERHSCPRWNRVIRQTVEDVKAAQPGWIPVTEKPIEGGQYIVTLKDDKEVWTDIAEWNPTFGGRWQAEFFDCEYRDIDNVVAWQPLPTPYREGGGQDGV